MNRRRTHRTATALLSAFIATWLGACAPSSTNHPVPDTWGGLDWKPYVEITTEGEWRVIRSNGIPDHAVGTFPNDNNPAPIQPQEYEFTIPLYPKYATSKTYLRLGERFGVNINGVPFDPEAAAYWDADCNCIRNLAPGEDPPSEWQADPLSSTGVDLGLDFNHAHVQPNGAYHYHGAQLSSPVAPTMQLVGWAFDGIPIYLRYGYDDPDDEASEVRKMKSGYVLDVKLVALGKTRRPVAGPTFADFPLGTFVQDYVHMDVVGDLDECNGRYGMTPHFELPTYHYFITDTFPYVPRCFQGTPTEK
jgi:hypothetical protein